MKRLACWIAAAAVGILSGCASAPGTIAVKEIGSFHVGGRTAVLSGLPEKEVRFTPTQPVTRLNPNGEFEVEQMYVQYVKVADSARRGAHPMVMIHGGGLAGVTWETKPDGGPSWQMYFLQQGHDVYIADAVERGRASCVFDITPPCLTNPGDRYRATGARLIRRKPTT